ncbi:hypothetical protein PF008_g32875, partial [Phytophthora fragariae]
MFTAAVAKIKPSDIGVSSSEWEGSVNSNLEQIGGGDLFVEMSNYYEGGNSVHVVSTSQLEAIHSKLCKLLDCVVSIEVGLRILDVFILQHNLKIHRNWSILTCYLRLAHQALAFNDNIGPGLHKRKSIALGRL